MRNCLPVQEGRARAVATSRAGIRCMDFPEHNFEGNNGNYSLEYGGSVTIDTTYTPHVAVL